MNLSGDQILKNIIKGFLKYKYIDRIYTAGFWDIKTMNDMSFPPNQKILIFIYKDIIREGEYEDIIRAFIYREMQRVSYEELRRERILAYLLDNSKLPYQSYIKLIREFYYRFSDHILSLNFVRNDHLETLRSLELSDIHFLEIESRLKYLTKSEDESIRE